MEERGFFFFILLLATNCGSNSETSQGCCAAGMKISVIADDWGNFLKIHLKANDALEAKRCDPGVEIKSSKS